MTYTTVRLECELDGGGLSIGTAFFLQYARGTDRSIPVLVTNGHVISGSKRLKVRLRAKNTDGSPNNRDQVHFDLSISEYNWIRHPNNKIDLAVLPAAGMLNEMITQKKNPFFISLREQDFPTVEQLNELGAVESIMMIGYPNGLWDETNNLPIVRAGITATHPAIDYNGKPEFVIDAACFGGSSGSPVFFYSSGVRTRRDGGTTMGSPMAFLLGVLYAGPMYNAQGDIVIVDVPTQKTSIAQSPIPMNLGYVIKSRCLMDFDGLFPATFP